MTALDITPEHLCIAVDRMGWVELERTARAILAALGMVAEAPGAHLRETTIAHGKAGASVPRSTPICKCGCPSLQDHWAGLLAEARDQDIARASHVPDDVPGGPEPRSFRNVVFRAAEDLHGIAHAIRPPAAEDAAGPEIADFICERYRGVPADRAAVLESRRRGQGFVSTSTIRRVRSRNGYGMELGEPQPADAEVADEVLTAHRQGYSDREIARTLDIGRRAVATMLDGKRTILGEAAA